MQKIVQFLNHSIDPIVEEAACVITLDDKFHQKIYSIDFTTFAANHLIIQVSNHISVTVQLHYSDVFALRKKVSCHVGLGAQVIFDFTLEKCSFFMLSFDGFIAAQASLKVTGKVKLFADEKCALIMRQIHEARAGESNCAIKGLVTDQARWWCENMILMQPEAQLSRAEQKTHILLLSPTARVQTVPALEVLQHDVQCKHGSAVACIDDEQRFYLMSRGLLRMHAEELIIQGFLG
ncbi:MAG: SufD family Fe-S cluster assembly protein [Candidatus Babeliaceae bacterium]